MTEAPITLSPAAIDIAEQPAVDDVWPRNPVAGAFVYLAAVWMVLMATAVVVRFARLPTRATIGVGVGVFVVLFGVLMTIAVRSIMRRRRRRAAGGTPSDSRSRVRLIGPAERCAQVAATVQDCAFEPVIFRSMHAVSFAVMENGRIKTYARRRRNRHVRTRVNRHGLGWVSLVASIIASAASVAMLQYVAFGSFRQITAFHVFAGIVGVAMFDALLMPVYVRIAPGVLDVMRYSILGMGRGHRERYDLRTAKVCVDLDQGYARIDDMSRAERPVLYLHVPSLLGGRASGGADILRGAVSTSATPPLPDDELLG